MRCFRIVVLIAAAALLPAAPAADLGVIGPTYPVGEQSALELIMQRLHAKERTGELAKLQEEGTRLALNSIKNMPPVAGIVTAVDRGQRLIDPSVTYTQAVTTDDGRIVIPAGTTINPLEVMGLSKTLVFFDGRDSEQADAVRQLVAQGGERIKPILVAGSWLDLTKAWKTQVYYDQHGTLSQRFGIRAVPAVIRQHDKMLVLDEIPPKELLQ
jgi:conjugal transfer pilus assembly protein TraW